MNSRGQSQIRELTMSELESISGGSLRLDFGIVVIDLLFADIETGPMTGAWICGENGCTSKMFGP
jgi:hypothetical protein